MKRVTLYVVIALLLLACQPDKSVSGASSDSLMQQVFQKEQWSRPQRTRSVTGTWTYSFPFFSSVLSIGEDGRFSYWNQGCLGSSYSAGSWKEEGGYYVLCSDERFREQKVPEALPVETTGTGDSIVYTVNVQQPDSFYIYFDHDRYLLKGDTLFGLNSVTGEISSRYTPPVE